MKKITFKNIEWRHVTWYSQLLAIILFLDVFGLGFWLGMQNEGLKIASILQTTNQAYMMQAHVMHATAAMPTITSVSYACDSEKKIEAVYKGDTVELSLSDGRSENLLQSISADGARYTNSDESFVFWSKGTGAFITESGKTTFNNCTEVTTPPAK